MFSTHYLDLPPLRGAAGSVTLPGSKSISNRVLLLAALCEGSTTIHDLLDSDDTRVMLAALKQLAAPSHTKAAPYRSRAWADSCRYNRPHCSWAMPVRPCVRSPPHWRC